MNNTRKWMRTTALLLCLIMIGVLLPVSSLALTTPSLISAKAEGSGIRVTWSAVAGASGYRVYRKTSTTSWSAVGDTTGTSFKDTKATAKVTYTYTVRAKDSGGKIASDYNKTGVSAAWSSDTAGWLGTPKMVGAKAESTGIRVTWNKVSGANGYRIYRKTATGKWGFLKDVGDVNNYLDTTPASGTKYFYTVRCMKSGSVVSNYESPGVSATWTNPIKPGYIAAPTMGSAVAEGSGLRVTWSAVGGAAAYRLYRRTSKTSWAELVDVSGTSYLDNATNAGETYYYTARCLNAYGTLISDYDKNGVSGSWKKPITGKLATPVMKSATSGISGVVVTWNAVTGATGYRIYRKTEGGSWTAIGESSGTSYTDTSAKSGTTYYYTVRAKDSSNTIASGYDSNGVKCTYYATPVLVSATSENDGIKVTWKAVGGAPLYLIYRKTSGAFSRLATTTATSFLDKKVSLGVEYTYTVRVISADQKTLLSDYDHTGVKAKFTGKAAITSLENKLDGIQVTWSLVTGASNYRLSRKTAEGGWTVLTETPSDNYLDTTAVNNTTHTYRVQALDGAGNVVGSYDENGVSKTFFATPTLISCVRANGGLLTTWEAVEGISNYVVYRRYGVGTWERVGTSASTSYLDMTPPSGTFCYYTVRCADASGNPVSYFRTPGVGETSYMDKPVLISAVSGNGVITVSWHSVDKATDYRVYRKTGDKTSWVMAKDITSALTWDDPNVVAGETYYYTVAVRRHDNMIDLSEYDTTGVKATYYDPPTLTDIGNGKTGIDLTWDVVDYIGTYHIYRKTGSETNWVSVGTSSTNKFTDTSAVSNAHYTYAIRGMISGADATGLSNTKDITYYAPPKMVSIVNNNGSVTVTWRQEAGIDKYRLYRKTGSGTYAMVTDIGAETYTDTSANVNGTKYTYTVRCMNSSGLVSEYNSTVSITYMKPVTNVKAVSAGTGKAKVTWTTEIGVKSYTVKRKTANTNWVTVATGITTGSYTDTLPSEGNYIYCVVAVANDGSKSADSASATVTVN